MLACCRGIVPIGRTAVSKTDGWEFESLYPCHSSFFASLIYFVTIEFLLFDAVALMTISQRQYDILNEIGIDLWQAKTSSKHKHVNCAEISKVDYEQLVQTQLFQDILMAMNIDADQHQLVSGHIDLGLINWHFSQENTCYYQDQLLVTPSLDDIKHSSQLKRQLWQTIYELRT